MKSDNTHNMNLAGVVAKHWRDVPPKEMVYSGFSTRLLWQDESGRKALMFEIAPGAVYPDLDVHAPGAEEVFVVSGEFCDGQNTYPAGTFIHHPAGTSHIPQSEAGCMLFVFFPEG
jgi:anti-sigma factor ChrR (cupin superfamily)